MEMDFAWHTRDEKLLVVKFWWEKQERKCCICGEEMMPYHRDGTRDPMRATLEHLIPKRENGPNTVANVRLAHAACNHALGALWEQNRQRKASGLPPIPDQWAINSAWGNAKARVAREQMTPLERARLHVSQAIDNVERKARGVKWCAENAVSLPRGATLLPAYAPIAEMISKGAGATAAVKRARRGARGRRIRSQGGHRPDCPVMKAVCDALVEDKYKHLMRYNESPGSPMVPTSA